MKTVAGTLLALSVILAVLLIKTWRENEGLKEGSHSLKLENVALRAAINSDQRNRSQSPTVGTGMVTDTNRNTPGRTTIAGTDPKKDPKHPRLAVRLYTRDVWRLYGTGIRKLGLSREKESDLVRLLVSRQEDIADSSDVAAERNLSEAERAALFQGEIAAANAQISGLIGLDGLKTIDNSTITQTFRNEVDGMLAVDYDAANLELTESQKDQIAAVMAGTQGNNYRYDIADDSAEAKGDLSQRGAAIVSQASIFLNAEQLKVLRDYEAEQFELWQSSQGH